MNKEQHRGSHGGGAPYGNRNAAHGPQNAVKQLFGNRWTLEEAEQVLAYMKEHNLNGKELLALALKSVGALR